MEKNKRGQGMSTNTIVLLIIAVIVLVILILGFTMGWEKVAPWLSTTNVDTVITSCETACALGGNYDFCSVERKLTDEKKNKFTASCASFATVDEFTLYGVKSCSPIACDLPCNQIAINGEVGVVTLPAGDSYDVSSVAQEDTCYVPQK